MSESPHVGRYKVKGKKGTIVRCGVEADTDEVCVLKHATIVHAVAECKNAKGDTRLRICRPIGGWLTMKTVVPEAYKDESVKAPSKRSGGSSMARGDWPDLSVPVDQIEITQRFVNLFGSGPTRALQFSTMPRHFVKANDGGKRVYFDSIGGIVPTKPSDEKLPTVAPRCGDAMPEADRAPVKDVYPERFVLTDKSTPFHYREAALKGSSGPPPGFDASPLIDDDDAIYKSIYAPTNEGGRGLPYLTKHAFDPWSRSSFDRRPSVERLESRNLVQGSTTARQDPSPLFDPGSCRAPRAS